MKGFWSGAALLLLVCCLWFPTRLEAVSPQQSLLLHATTKKTPAAASEEQKPLTAEELLAVSPDKLHTLLAAMSDEQVRRLLIATLAESATPPPAGPQKPKFVQWLDGLREHVHFLRQRVQEVVSGTPRAGDLLPEDLRQMLAERGALPVPAMLWGLAALFVVWWGCKRLLRYKLRGLLCDLTTTADRPKLGARLLRLLFKGFVELMVLLLAALVTVLLYLAVFHDAVASRTVLFLFLVIVVFFELVLWLVRLVLVPDAGSLRLLPFTDAAARQLYRIVQVLVLEAGLGLAICGVLQLTSASEAVYLLTLMGTGLVLVLTVALVSIWKAREVAEALRDAFPEGTLRWQLAGSWHVIITGYVFFFWLFWMAHVLASGRLSMLPAILTFLAFPAYLMVSWAADRLVAQTGILARDAKLEPGAKGAAAVAAQACDTTPGAAEDQDAPAGEATPSAPVEQVLPLGDPTPEDSPVARFRRVLSKALGVVLFAAFLTVLTVIWDVKLPLAERVVQGAFSVLVTLLLAYAFWAFAKAAIERRLRAQLATASTGLDAYTSTAMGARLSTLLELLKRFVFVTLVVVVTLIVLSAIGVDTSPLLAGAGVIGIALGFGSQTLVKDVVSGVFFLMDDAFRIGDYIDLGHSRGTVEGISVRSLKLRHHRGSLYTVPYGSISMVNNLTRDWAIMKLEYLVPFDTDVQQVKKIVKRINKELKEIPELADLMLGDVKDQGVKEIEDYGLRMRIKMTTKPGGQFTLRKWIWGKLRRYFDEAGIHFAHRKVSVVLDEGYAGEPEKARQLAAAAAQAVQSQLEDERTGKA